MIMPAAHAWPHASARASRHRHTDLQDGVQRQLYHLPAGIVRSVLINQEVVRVLDLLKRGVMAHAKHPAGRHSAHSMDAGPR
jgi:hypothetical protein